MQVIERDIWLCPDCMVLHETGDATSFDYHYDTNHRDDGTTEADRRLVECEHGLDTLGPHLVSDNTEDNTEQRECRECGHIGADEDFVTKVEREGTDEEESFQECPKCHSYDTEPRDSGREEFSNRGCDCCGSKLAGSFHRYAILGE